MRCCSRPCIAFLLTVGFPSALLAQISVAPRVGTLGVGVDVGLGLANVITARFGGGYWPGLDLTISDLDGIDYSATLPSTFTAGFDLHPGGGGFHLSGGLLFQTNDLSLRATPSDDVGLGDGTYTPAEVGTLAATLVNKDVAPFLLLGFGKHGTGGVGLFLDLGVAFMGEPEIGISANGALAANSDFLADLGRHAASVEDDDALKTWGRFWPIVSLGLRIGVGGGNQR